MRFNPDSPAERSRRRNPRRSCCRWAKRAGLYFAGLRRKNGPRWIHPGGIWGRRGTIGGYWGGYSSLSSSPTHKALPGKVENLTPSANSKNSPAPGRQQQQKRPGRPTHNAPPPRPFSFCLLCRAAHTAPPAAANARRAPPAAASTPPHGLLHTMPAPPACPMPAYSRPPRHTAPPAHCQP